MPHPPSDGPPHAGRVYDATLSVLCGRVATGDPDAFAHLYDLTIDRVYDRITSLVPSVEEAQELARDVMVDVWRRAPAIPTDSVLGWIIGEADQRAHRWATTRSPLHR